MSCRAILPIVAVMFGAAMAEDGKDTNAKDCLAGSVRLVLPETIHAAPGVEANVYFDNVILAVNPANYVFDVSCAKGAQQAERWTFVPSAADVGSYPFVLEVRDGANGLVARGKSTIRVVAAGAGEKRSASVLLIGDSLTHASVSSQRLLDLCVKAGNPALTLVGSHAPKGDAPHNRHEGYGGWTAKRFVTHYTGTARTGHYRQRGSPFLYADEKGKPRLDFAHYCRDVNDGKPPDFVVIFLGCNDVFGANDETIEAVIDEMMGHMDTLIGSIRGFGTTTRIGLIPPVPPAASQDAFGANYRCGQTRWQYKRNQHRVVERMMAMYGGREAERVSIIPAFVNIDAIRNFPRLKAKANAHTTVEITRLNNSVHPSAEGYLQIGDSVYCWIGAVGK